MRGRRRIAGLTGWTTVTWRIDPTNLFYHFDLNKTFIQKD